MNLIGNFIYQVRLHIGYLYIFIHNNARRNAVDKCTLYRIRCVIIDSHLTYVSIQEIVLIQLYILKWNNHQQCSIKILVEHTMKKNSLCCQ